MAATDPSAIEKLRTALQGSVYIPGDEGYDKGRQAFNLNAHQEPALVVVAEDATDVVAAVRLARDQGLGVGVLATGHGVAAPCDGGVLINTSRMRSVRVDPEAQTARVEAGVLWSDIVPEAQTHGLMGLAGSSSGVGVVGYTLGGGYGWLGRKHGFAAESMREAELVTADGELIKATAHERTLRPLGRRSARRDDHFRNVPELPAVAGITRGAARRVRDHGAGLLLWGSPEAGEELMRPWRELGDPVTERFRTMSCGEMDSISMDPTDPTAA